MTTTTRISDMTAGTYELAAAKRNGDEALTIAIAATERLLNQLRINREAFRAAERPIEQANFINWTINELACNLMPNVRLDMLAHAQARLLVAREIAKSEGAA